MASPSNKVTTKATTPLVQTINLSTEICGMQGVALWGAEDNPFLVTSEAEFEEKAGKRSAAFPMLYDSAMAYFRNGGKKLYVNRVGSSGAAKSGNITQAAAQDTLTMSGRFKGARGNTIAKKYTRTSLPAGLVAAVVVAGSTSTIPVTAPSRFNIGDQVAFVEGADTKRGVVSAINGTNLVLAQAITVPVGGYTLATTVTIENYRLDVYDSNVLRSTYLNLQTSPLSPFYFVNVIGQDDNRIIDLVLAAVPPTFAANTDTRPTTDTNPVLLTGGVDGSTPTDAEIKGTQAAFTGIWAWDRIRDVLFISAPGILSIASTTVAIYKEAEVFERYRQNLSPVIFIADPPAALSPSQMKVWWTTTLAATSRGMSTWYPWLKVKDPVTGLLVARPPSGFIMGKIVSAQKTKNIAQGPAGDYGKLDSTVYGTELDPPLQEGDIRYDDLYDVGINGIIILEGSSAANAWGNQTADYLGQFAEWHVTTVFAIAQRELKKLTRFVNFQFNDTDTQDQVERVVRSYFRQLFSKGVLDGANEEEAFFVICNEDINTESIKSQRKLVARYGLRVKHLAEFVEQTLEQDTRALAAENPLQP